MAADQKDITKINNPQVTRSRSIVATMLHTLDALSRQSMRKIMLSLMGILLLSVSTGATSPLSPSFLSRRMESPISRTVSSSKAPQLPVLLILRGGSVVDESDEEDLSDDDDLFDAFAMGDEGEDDFAEENFLDRTIQDFHKTPPLTKAYIQASMLATTYGYLVNKNEFPSFLSLDWNSVLWKAQIWRPFTTFLNFGPIGLGYLLTVHFVWTYMSTLERLHHHKPYDFWIMIFFGMLSMVVGYPAMKMNPRFLGHNISTFLVYIWSRYHEGLEVNLFELFNIRAELLPWFFLAQVSRLPAKHMSCRSLFRMF
jgi:hypothetical protein